MGSQWQHGPEYGVDDKGQPWYRVGNYRLKGVKHNAKPVHRCGAAHRRDGCRGHRFPDPLPESAHLFPLHRRARRSSYCRAVERCARELCQRHGDRLAGSQRCPCRTPTAAAAELSRAVNELGLVGGAIGTDFGVSMESRDVDVLYDVACEEDVPLFVHGVPAGIDGPPGDPNCVGSTWTSSAASRPQITIAVATLIYGGVMRRYPGLKVCFSEAAARRRSSRDACVRRRSSGRGHPTGCAQPGRVREVPGHALVRHERR